MAYQGEYFIDRYGKAQAERAPPIRRMLAAGVPVAAGTDATRVASYNPFVSLYWLVSGKTIGGTAMYTDANRLDRMEALRLWTKAGAWFSNEEGQKGALVPGQLADLAVLSADYFAIPEEDIKRLESVLTMVGGEPVYATAEFGDLSPPGLPVVPEWSPVAHYGGYQQSAPSMARVRSAARPNHAQTHGAGHVWGVGGCACWAF